MRAVISILIFQVLGVLIILFGDIGFDFPGKFGLDFGHLLLILLFEGGSVIFLFCLSMNMKTWPPFLLSISIIVIGAFCLLYSESSSNRESTEPTEVKE